MDTGPLRGAQARRVGANAARRTTSAPKKLVERILLSP